jgi:serine/threonine protein kinase
MERVGDYILQQVLGTGSFGQVMLGVHNSSRARVAVKVLPKNNADDATIRRISVEVSTMEKTGSGCPFIVRLHEVLVGTHHIYLVVEYAAGGELFKTMFKPETYDEDEESDIGKPEREQRARFYFQQLVLGLHWCHKQGVAHRDVKPQNLLLSMDGVLKIADFGLAASFNLDQHVSKRSLRQTMCGSPLYMAPEMLSLSNGATYDAITTDTWGCGAVLYGMLCGSPPFPATSFTELVSMAQRPHVHLKLPCHIPKSLGLLIRAMLRVDPHQRFNLMQVAQHPWYQTDLQETLARTPHFRPPEGMGPIDLNRSASRANGGSYAPPSLTWHRALYAIARLARGVCSMLGAWSPTKIEIEAPPESAEDELIIYRRRSSAKGGEGMHSSQSQATTVRVRTVSQKQREERPKCAGAPESNAELRRKSRTSMTVS